MNRGQTERSFEEKVEREEKKQRVEKSVRAYTRRLVRPSNKNIIALWNPRFSLLYILMTPFLVLSSMLIYIFFYPRSSFLLLRLRSSDLELNRFNEAKYGKNRQQGSVQHKDGSKEVRQDSNLPVEAALRVQ